MLVNDDYQQGVIKFVKDCKNKGLSILTTVTELTNKQTKVTSLKGQSGIKQRLLVFCRVQNNNDQLLF